MPSQDSSAFDLNTLLHQVHRLQDSWLERERTGRFFVEGIRHFLHLTEAGFEVDAVLHCRRLLKSSICRHHIRHLEQLGTRVVRLSPEQFRRVSRTERASGIGVVVQQRWSSLTDLLTTEPACWIAISRVNSPGNLGTLIRTADAVGANGFLFLGQINPYDPNILRASMAGVYRQTFARTALQELKIWATQHNYTVVGASPDGRENFQQFDFPPKTILLLGEERQGMTDEEKLACDHLVRIPMRGGADSLNLGVAGSLLLYERFRAQIALQ